MGKKKEIIRLITGFLGSILGCFGVISFNQYLLMSLPLVVRMVLMIVVYWLIALIPIIIVLYDKTPLSYFGFKKEGKSRQIGIGVLLGLAMSFIFTLLPHFLGYGDYVDTGKRYQFAWQFIYEFVWCILAVGAVEEFVFRGFLYEKSKKIFKTDIAAIILSSVLFGMFHIFHGDVGQIVLTGFIGAIFCLCRKYIKNCSTLSLIMAHGIYDALITVWVNCLQ